MALREPLLRLSAFALALSLAPNDDAGPLHHSFSAAFYLGTSLSLGTVVSAANFLI